MSKWIVAAFVLGAAPAAWGQNPGVFDPDSNPFGESYGDWGADWWTWAAAIPLSESPVADTTGAFCAADQDGPVWFLAGSFGSTVERTCTIPGGKALFFPLLNRVCAKPGNGNGDAMIACASLPPETVVEMDASIDGVPLVDLIDYRGTSDIFSLTWALGRNKPKFYDLAASDGYWLMLEPLSAGTHTVHFHGLRTSGFELDVTYHLTVTP